MVAVVVASVVVVVVGTELVRPQLNALTLSPLE